MKMKLIGALGLVALLAACSGNENANTGAASGMGASAAPTGAAAPGSEADLVANVGDRVYFALNESNLSSDAQATLEQAGTGFLVLDHDANGVAEHIIVSI